jgi:hypothetical protein
MKDGGMKDAGMRNAGEAMEKVLAGLRDAAAPDGMERRILAGLEERAAVRSRSGWRQLLPVWLVAPARPVAVGSLVCGVALAGIVVVVFAIPAIRRLGHTPMQAPQQAGRNSVPAGAAALTAAEAAAESGRSALPRAGALSIGKRKAERSAAGADVVLDSDSAALEEMHAASYPAPPMPLTEQERLLLRLVHKDDPVELAMLDPKLRALQDLEDKAEFQRFFGQSMKQTTPEQTATEQAAPQPSTTEQVPPATSATEQATPVQPGTEQAVPEPPVPDQSVPDQSVPDQSVPDQAVPDQAVPEQAVPQQAVPQPATPETSGPDQSTTPQAMPKPQQAMPKPTRTGENE